MVTNIDIAVWVIVIAGLSFIALLMWPRKAPRQPIKRIHGRRDRLIRELLPHKYLDHYELARRTGVPFADVSKLLATALRDGEAIERIKRQVEVPLSIGSKKKKQTVWCYRIKNVAEIYQEGTIKLAEDLPPHKAGDTISIKDATDAAQKALSL